MKNLQKKIEEYSKKIHSKSGIGELYERQIRYLYEKSGWRVVPYGILKGKNDLGRDLICTKKKQVLIIQAKNWSKNKTIHENHIMQLAGTILYYIYKNNRTHQGLFITTTKLSDRAKEVGLVSSLHDNHEGMLERAFEIAEKLISKTPLAMWVTKEVLNYSRDHSVKEGLDNVNLWNAATLHKEDVMTTMMSKMQKKKPEYKNLKDKNFLKHKSNKK